MMINLFHKLFFFAALFILNTGAIVFASEKDLIDLAEAYNKNGEYYNTITEIMRYQYLFPNGKYFGLGMLMMGEAYYKGGNYNKALNTFAECSERFRDKPEGEKAFYSIGYVNMTMGAPYLALRKYQEYQYLYKEGAFTEDVSRDICYTLALMRDLDGAGEAVKKYELDYTNGKYTEDIMNLELLINEEVNRPKKSVWISVIGSIFVPGFGHFYTGKYDLGIFSLVSNAVFIYLFYDGYRDRNKMQMAVFGLAEFSVYQYSLYSSISDVYEYNKNEGFYKSIRLSAEKEF